MFIKKNIRECGLTEKLGLRTQAEKVERGIVTQEYHLFWSY